MSDSPSISTLPRTHSTTIKKFRSLGIETFADLLRYYPRRYIDYSRSLPISMAQPGELVTVQGVIKSYKTTYARNHFTIQRAVVEDVTGTIELLWFNQLYIARLVTVGATLAAAGIIEQTGSRLTMKPAEFEILSADASGKHTGKIVPLYPERHGLSSRLIREKIDYILSQDVKQEEWLPSDMVNKEHLFPYDTAIRLIHQPMTLEDTEKARQRLGFDELFTMQLSNLLVKKTWSDQVVKMKFVPYPLKIKKLIGSLPFSLTPSQLKAWQEIYTDMGSEHPMNRFLQGDVGSGKTVVAAIAAYLAHLNGVQTVFMAPTEILATQHFATFQKILPAYPDVEVELVTAHTKRKEKHTASILIGTHALISAHRKYKNVGLVIVDEQHRFGVEQRAKLKNLGTNPHLLSMTATPIPRTIALTLYGALDMSILTDMPTGRQQVKTYVVTESKRDSAYAWIRKEVAEHQAQVFIICPRIEDPEEDDEQKETVKSMKAAVSEYERLKKDIFPGIPMALLHGKVPAKEKDVIIEDFRAHRYSILVSTTVVEVGIDIPGATIILIEDAQQFGLSQLHQLRGRVGRNDKLSHCLLFTSKNATASERLQFFSKTNKGIELAEYDLKARGAGDMYGKRQHGYAELMIADLSDANLVSRTYTAAKSFLDTHTITEYPLIAGRLAPLSADLIAKD